MISSFNNLSFLGIPKPFQLLPIFSLIIFFLSFTSSSLAEEEKKFQLQVYMTKKQAFEVAFPGADKVEKERQWLTDMQRQAIGKLCLQTIKETRFTFYVGKKKWQANGLYANRQYHREIFSYNLLYTAQHRWNCSGC